MPEGAAETSEKKLRSTNSEAKLECARERRLRQGFKQRIFLEKNQDILGVDGFEANSVEDNKMLES